MRRIVIAVAGVLSLNSAGVLAQTTNPSVVIEATRAPVKSGPHFKIDCVADPSRGDPLITANSATIWSPRAFHTTDSKFRLKFYAADIEFEGDLAPVRIDKAALFESQGQENAARFPDLGARAADDDFPTTFERAGQLYEVQAMSSLPRKMDGQYSFSIKFNKAFSILIEALPADGSRRLAWAGTCKFNKAETAS